MVPKINFLATLLLPCGKVDEKVKKFTGSDDIGDAPDNMTKAIHAFAHWSLLYSQGHILFCDLQGTFILIGNEILLGNVTKTLFLTGALDFKGVMCLFDPQAHTCVLYKANPFPPSSNLAFLLSSNRNIYHRDQRSVYWDGGPAKIEAFRKQHAPMCKDNWVCTKLGLQNMIVEEDTDTETSTPTSPKENTDSDRRGLTFILLEKNTDSIW